MRLRHNALLSAFLFLAPITVAAGAHEAHAAGAAANRRVLRSPLDPNHASLAALPATGIVQIGQHQFVHEQMYSELKTAMKVFLKKFNPKTHFFVGLGRDPAPITAFLQALGGKELAINFVGSSGKNYFQQITPAHMKPFVEAQIPKEVLFGDRTIVLYDQTANGGTLGAYDRGFPDAFEEYLRSIGSTVRVERAAFTNLDYSSATFDGYRARYNSTKKSIHQIDLTALPEVQKFLVSPYEGTVAQHNRRQMDHGYSDTMLVELPNYATFKAGLEERMKRDTDLDAFLTTEIRATSPATDAELKAIRKQEKVENAAARKKIADDIRALRKSGALK